jgi:hypothetical protein
MTGETPERTGTTEHPAYGPILHHDSGNQAASSGNQGHHDVVDTTTQTTGTTPAAIPATAPAPAHRGAGF